MPEPLVYAGPDAWAKLGEDGFLNDWTRLYEGCPWSTGYQSPDFGITWFESYRTRYAPLLIAEYGPTGELSGLLCLAHSIHDGELVVVGAHQAEYHVWLSDARDAAAFGVRAIRAALRSVPNRDLRFAFIPGGFPIAALREVASRVSHAELRVRHRPLMRVDAKELDDSFRKKSNKSRFNRLKALGQLEFVRVTDVATFAPLLREVGEQYDFRQATAHGALAFREDPIKMPFHLALLARNPDLLHVTVTTLDGHPIAAHIGVSGKGELHLAIITFCPMHARHSTGKLHLMQLGRELVREGFSVLDLTPGDEPWKERFANARDDVYELVVHRGVATQTARAMRLRIGTLARAGFARGGIAPDTVRGWVARVRRASVAGVARRAARMVWEHHEARIYRYPLDRFDRVEPDERFRRDSLDDLLRFASTDRHYSTQELLTSAMARLEAGEHVYTYVENGQLLHFGWLVDRQEQALITEVGKPFRFPPGSSVLYDFYTDPGARGRGLYRSNITRMLSDAGREGVPFAYIVVEASNAASRHVIESLGFEYQSSLYRTTRFGRVQGESAVDDTAPAAAPGVGIDDAVSSTELG